MTRRWNLLTAIAFMAVAAGAQTRKRAEAVPPIDPCLVAGAQAAPAAQAERAKQFMSERNDSLARIAAVCSVPIAADTAPDGPARLEQAARIFASYAAPDADRVADYVGRLDALGPRAAVLAFTARQWLLQALTLDGTNVAALESVARETYDRVAGLPAPMRLHVARPFVAAVGILADAANVRGAFDSASTFLQHGIDLLSDSAELTSPLRQRLHSQRFLGSAAPPIETSHWINAPTPQTRLPRTGRVTLLVFSAHWCIPCAKSYPWVRAMMQRYSATGLDGVLVTQTYGYIGTRGDLSVADEVKADSTYFLSEHRLPLTLAVFEGGQFPVGSKHGRSTLATTAYGVGGIPHFVVIDRAGIVRFVVVGNSVRTKAEVESVITRLLATS